MTREERFRIASWPAPAATRRADFSYPELFQLAMRDAGVEFRELSFRDDWLERNAAVLDAIHLHWVEYASGAADAVRERHRPRGTVVVMPLGSYEGVFPQARDRAVVRSQLGLAADRPLVACLGALGDYKGFDVACDAVARLSGDVQLLIAGRPRPGFDTAPLRERVRLISGARIVDRNLTAEELADFANASDAWLLPYRRTTGSAALLAAWSLGRGVIASDLPYFRDLIAAEPGCGEVFANGDAGALAGAIQRYLAVPDDRRERAALAQRDRYAWSRCIRPVVEVLQEWRRAGHR